MNWDEVKELAPLYVIGALDDKTAHEFESSLLGATEEQQGVIARWRDVATFLPQALALQTPEPGLKDKLLSRIAGEIQQTPLEVSAEESALEEKAEQSDRKVLPFIQPRQVESKTVRWMLIAATALLAFGCGYLFKQNSELARERDDLSQEVVSWKRQLDDIVSSKTRVIAMTGDETPQANAKVIWNTKDHQWEIYIFDLPAPPSDKDYQLWYVTKEAKISAAVFRTNEDGRTVLKLTLPPEALSGLAATAVTLEPKGGSAQPTSKIYLKASI